MARGILEARATRHVNYDKFALQTLRHQRSRGLRRGIEFDKVKLPQRSSGQGGRALSAGEVLLFLLQDTHIPHILYWYRVPLV